MKILTIGAGAYGLALSTILSEKNEVTVYSSLKDEIDNLKKTHKNEKLFSNLILPNKIEYTNDIRNTNSDVIIIALPSNIIKKELEKIKENLIDKKIIIATKGIYEKKFMHEILKEFTNNIYVLSGPSFAKDIIEKQPLTLTLAGTNTKKIKEIFNEQYINIEETKDIIGTEICGALKNTFAIGSGILKGLNASDSTIASYLTKIINDTKRIIKEFDGNENTVLLSCGIGDILLTCTSEKSRNFSLGYMIGNNETKETINTYLENTTIEGLSSLIEFKQIYNIEIINILYDIIYNNKNPKEILSYIVK